MFEVSQVSVFIRFRMILGDGGVRFFKEGESQIEHPSYAIFLGKFDKGNSNSAVIEF